VTFLFKLCTLSATVYVIIIIVIVIIIIIIVENKGSEVTGLRIWGSVFASRQYQEELRCSVQTRSLGPTHLSVDTRSLPEGKATGA